MSQAFTTRTLSQVFTFPFRDPQWLKKMVIGSLIYMVSPFILFLPLVFGVGYCAEIMRRIIHAGEKPSLPEWTDWERLFIDGSKLTGVGLVYFLPAILVGTVAFSIMLLPIFLAGAAGNAGSAAEPSFFFAIMLTGQVFIWITLLLSVVGTIFAAGGYGHMVANESFLAGFRVREWWPIFRANWGGFLISYLLFLALNWVLTMAIEFMIFSVVFCVIGLLALAVVGFYEMLILYALFALAYREGVEQRELKAT
jgi:hypothetical protein